VRPHRERNVGARLATRRTVYELCYDDPLATGGSIDLPSAADEQVSFQTTSSMILAPFTIDFVQRRAFV